MDLEISAIIKALGLAPHPEGGYFKEVFRSSCNASTAIYFLLPAGIFSAWHRVKNADEIWHHYSGDPVELHMINEAGEYSMVRLGQDLAKGERPQAVVPANVWQAAAPVGKRYALCGCTVAPGFEFSNFEMPLRQELLDRFPQYRETIEKFTRA